MAYDPNDPIKHIDEVPSDPYGIESSDIDSGVRKTLNTCQYWIKGMSGHCKYWETGDPGNCIYGVVDNEKKRVVNPTGYNGGSCDYLGRQYSCDKYELEGDEDLDQYICVAPSPERSGLHKEDEATGLLIAVSISDVRGYNADGDFVGQCDGCGVGKGSAAHGKGCASDEFGKLPVVCNYYKPWQIGFGSKVPKTTDVSKLEPDERGLKLVDERDDFDDRLPLSFKVYNVRAQVQKCAYWDTEEGSEFVLEAAGELHLEDGDQCSNTDPNASPYHTEADVSPPEDMLLENVWAEAGCVICNGAKSECPGYTGKWIYCVDDKLEKGDKVSAQQILELRFWMNDWASQDEYDSVFKKPPNKTDPSTSSIYTYGYWDLAGDEPIDALLGGKEVKICVPNSRNEFSSDVIQTSAVTFINRGTAAPNQIQFSSLVRDIESLGVVTLHVTFPYATKDPFDETKNPPCGSSGEPDPTPCVVRNYSPGGISVSMVGYTIRNSDMYAFNATTDGYGGIGELLANTTNLATQKWEEKVAFNEKMYEFIKELDEDGESSLTKGSSNEDGFFTVGPVDLEYQKDNVLIVCFEYGDAWIFKKRKVWPQWHAGVIHQTHFDHTYEGGTSYADDGYHTFTPPATARGRLTTLEGNNRYGLSTKPQSLFRVSRELVYSSPQNYHYNYSYCFKKITKKNQIIEKWLRTDTAGSLWLEIDDTNLNYVLSWDVDKAEAIKKDAAGNVTETITMQKIEITSIPPNCCVIKPAGNEKVGVFAGDDWEIKLDYWYYTLSNNDDEEENESIVYPSFGGSIRFAAPGYELEYDAGGDSFSVNEITNETMGLMAFFSDEEGRTVSTFATKLMVDVARVFCRDIEIFYGWSVDAEIIHLTPTKGFVRIEVDGPFTTQSVGSTTKGSMPPCADHDVSPGSNTGPMWYPYDSCDTIDYYDIWTGANQVMQPHEEWPRDDYRFMLPLEYEPFCWPHATLWDCANDWGCGYEQIKMDSARFTGQAKYRGGVDPEIYIANQWPLPKFGNSLREYVERFRSIDNNSHISLKTYPPSPSIAWMPMVMDVDSIYISFNCIEANDIAYVNPLNLFRIQSNVGESISKSGGGYTRYRFEDLFEIRKTGLASYPKPLMEDSESALSFVTYYYFKISNMVWAWQEAWRDIVRSTDGAVPLSFVSLGKPLYVFDRFKEEHRLIAEEGIYELVYKAPQFDDDGKIEKWPSIKLGGGQERYFKILQDQDTPYSSYDHSYVDWSDENEGMVDGSGGGEDDEKNIYEETMAGSWVTSQYGLGDMIYDSEAVKTVSAADDAERLIEVSYDAITGEAVSYAYNRGIIANIYKDGLKYLPYEERSLSGSDYNVSYSDTPLEGYDADGYPGTAMANWSNPGTVDIDLDFGQENTHCIKKLKITGYKGNIIIPPPSADEGAEPTKSHLNQPRIALYEKSGGSWGERLAYRDALYQTAADKKAGVGVSTWDKEIEMSLSPTRMITNKASAFRITLTNMVPDEGISVHSVVLYAARYKDRSESIKVWERKFIISTGTVGNHNPDGEQRMIGHQWNRDNSGQYYNSTDTGAAGAQNKMRRWRGGERGEDGEDITANSYGDVIKVEAMQEELYNTAYNYDVGDNISYSSILPPTFDASNINIVNKSNISSLNGVGLTLHSARQGWNDIVATDSYEDHDLWAPKGFLYRWNTDYRTSKCYLTGPTRKLAGLDLVDVYNNTEEAAKGAVHSLYTMKPYHIEVKLFKDQLFKSDIGKAYSENPPGRGIDGLLPSQ